jgi:hypothetical protein
MRDTNCKLTLQLLLEFTPAIKRKHTHDLKDVDIKSISQPLEVIELDFRIHVHKDAIFELFGHHEQGFAHVLPTFHHALKHLVVDVRVF